MLVQEWNVVLSTEGLWKPCSHTIFKIFFTSFIAEKTVYANSQETGHGWLNGAIWGVERRSTTSPAPTFEMHDLIPLNTTD